MANKPERFSQEEIRREIISPEELESWVRYVLEDVYESFRKAGIEISKDDIRLTVHLSYPKYEYDFLPVRKCNGRISVETTRPGGFTTFFVIAPFADSSDAKKTFEAYAIFKKVDITERDEKYLARREIEVSVS